MWDDHAAILDAVRAGDGDRAEALARGHAEHGEQVILSMMADSATITPIVHDKVVP